MTAQQQTALGAMTWPLAAKAVIVLGLSLAAGFSGWQSLLLTWGFSVLSLTLVEAINAVGARLAQKEWAPVMCALRMNVRRFVQDFDLVADREDYADEAVVFMFIRLGERWWFDCYRQQFADRLAEEVQIPVSCPGCDPSCPEDRPRLTLRQDTSTAGPRAFVVSIQLPRDHWRRIRSEAEHGTRNAQIAALEVERTPGDASVILRRYEDGAWTTWDSVPGRSREEERRLFLPDQEPPPDPWITLITDDVRRYEVKDRWVR